MSIHNLKTAAEFLKCCTEHLRQLAGSGKITASKVAGKWLFEEQELVNYVRSGYAKTAGQQLRVIDGGKQTNKEALICPSINAKQRGGFHSPRPVESEYANLLGLTTKPKRKNSTTGSSLKVGERHA